MSVSQLTPRTLLRSSTTDLVKILENTPLYCSVIWINWTRIRQLEI
uniref:Uncharacterized protein n=1 Tax=Anguilla anguilla TaxID=7936 RepID=A0A0E9VTC4_ANGAN